MLVQVRLEARQAELGAVTVLLLIQMRLEARQAERGAQG